MTYLLQNAARVARGARGALGDVTEAGKPQPPISPLIVGGHGGYQELRSTPADGSCGIGTYPCRHPGLDVYGPQGTPVVAPESGQIVALADGSGAPFMGYGPWLAVIQGDGGKFHLLGHLDPNTSDQSVVGQRVTAGDQIGTTSSANHTHWEVRDRITPAAGGDNFTNGMNPQTWLTLAQVVSSSLGKVLVVGSAATLIYLLWRRRRR